MHEDFKTTLSPMSFKCDLGLGDILIFTLKWILITIITFGIGGMFYLFSLAKQVINKSYVIDSNGNKRALKSNLNLGDDFGFLIIWTILSIITFGIASFFFLFYFLRYVINKTELV